MRYASVGMTRGECRGRRKGLPFQGGPKLIRRMELLANRRCRSRARCCVGREFLREVAVVPQIVIEDAGQFRRFGAECWTASFEEEHGDDPAVGSVGKRSKPSITG